MKRAIATTLIWALALLPLSACGFTPVYGSGADAMSGSISIPEIRGRTGHFLRQELALTVGPGLPGIPAGAQLEVSLSEGIERLAFTPDQAASRSDYIGNATYTLTRADGVVAATGSVREAASFNFADAAYADIAAQTAAQERLASLLARSIRDKLVIDIGRTGRGDGAVKPPQLPTGQTSPVTSNSLPVPN